MRRMIDHKIARKRLDWGLTGVSGPPPSRIGRSSSRAWPSRTQCSFYGNDPRISMQASGNHQMLPRKHALARLPRLERLRRCSRLTQKYKPHP